MELNQSTEIRKDFTATSEEAVYTARVYEGVVTVSVSGLSSAPSTLSVPADNLGELAEFLTLLAQANQ